MQLKIRYLLLAIIVSSIIASCKQSSHDSNQEKKGILFQKEISTSVLDSIIQAKRQEYNVPAVSIALIKDGQITYSKNYGIVNSISKEPISQESVFEAASITKPVFAYTVCLLAQKGIIGLDDTLHERFPFPESQIEKYPCYKNMTVRHVLTHVSGLPNWGVDLTNCPGEKYGYSGQGFEFLTKALAKSFTEEMDRTILKYLQEEVLTPLNMNNTYFIESETLTSLCVDGHLKNKPNAQEFPESPEMAFGMHCNAVDIGKFAIGLLQRKGLNEDMSKDMFTFHTELPKEEEEFEGEGKQGYGLGIYLRNSPHGLVFGHSGSNYDFMCLFEVYDELNMGYVIMTNSDTGDEFIKDVRTIFIEN